MNTQRTIKVIIVSGQAPDSISGLKQFQKKLAQECNGEISSLQYEPGERRDIIGEIKAFHPDVLITTDLAGFEQCTLTDNISYNLLDCKQLHLLFHRDLPNEPYLAGQLSIAMFFYCAGDAYCDDLARKYPNLPYLKSFSEGCAEADIRDGERNAENLYRAFQEVLRECGLLQ